MSGLFDTQAAEEAVLGAVLRHGRDVFLDVDALVDVRDLADDTNQAIYASLREYYEDGAMEAVPDYPGLVAAARRIGLGGVFDRDDTRQHLRRLKAARVQPNLARAEAGRLLKLRIAEGLYDASKEACDAIARVTGDEPLARILAMVEGPVLDYTSRVGGDAADTHQIGRGAREWLEHNLANPRQNLGIPSPFPKYNGMIGGGFRRRGVAMIGGRAKSGKTGLVDTIGEHVAGTLGIPVLNVDTEMTAEEHWARMLASRTGIPIKAVEQGLVTPEQADRLREAADRLADIPYYYRSVIDESFEEQVASMRRWCVKTVGVDGSGVRNDCLVIYDYLQLTDPGEFSGNSFKEYQILGFQMVALTRLAKKYDVPILSFLQLNREGLKEESVAVAAGSDRIIWKCSNFSIFKPKSEEEMAEDGPHEGNRKLIPLIARHGPGADPGDYISLKFERETARLSEGRTKFEIKRAAGATPSDRRTFEVDDEPQDIQLE